MLKFADHATGIADILRTDLVQGENEVRAALGFYQGEDADNLGIGADTPVWSMFGFACRPMRPTAEGTCLAYYISDGDQKRILLTRDARPIRHLPALKEGETILHGFKGQFVRFHENGGITLFITDDGTPEGRSIYLKLAPDDGVEKAPGLIFESPWLRCFAGKKGFRVLDGSGAELEIGSLGGLPAPLGALASMIKLKAGIVSIQGGAISIGNPLTPGLSNEAAVLALTNVLLALGVLAAALVPVTGVAPGAQAPFAAALAAAIPLLQNLGKPA